jgi:hypothetical protein
LSQENVKIVRRYLKAPEAVPPEQFPAWIARFWESDGDYYPVPGFSEARPCHGREEIVGFLAGLEDIVGFLDGLREPWEFRMELQDARAIGDDRVYAHGHVWAAGRKSGVSLDGHLHYCFWLRHGRFVRAEEHLSEEDALHALGLSGEALEAAGVRE